MTAQWRPPLSHSRKGLSPKTVTLAEAVGKREGQSLTRPVAETSHYIRLNFFLLGHRQLPKRAPPDLLKQSRGRNSLKKEEKNQCSLWQTGREKDRVWMQTQVKFHSEVSGDAVIWPVPTSAALFASVPWTPGFKPDLLPNSATPSPPRWSSLWLSSHNTLSSSACFYHTLATVLNV